MENHHEEIKKILSNLEKMKKIITAVQTLVTQEDCHNLIGSLSQQMKKKINAKGDITKY